MPAFSDKVMAIAAVYAKAMLELGEERGSADELGEELGALAAEIERDPRLGVFLGSPRIDADRRAESLERIFRGHASDLFADALGVLNRKGRIGLVPAISEVYRRLLDELRGRVEARVTSAQALSDDQRRRLTDAIAARTGRRPVLRERVDPGLIGGVVVQIGDHKIDGSVVHKIETLSKALLARASRQIQSGAHFSE